MSEAETVALAPCLWCNGTDVKLFVSFDGDERVEYAQCQDCTACGPDHKNGRHWNDGAKELKRLLRYAVEYSSARVLFPETFVEDAKQALGS